MFLFSIIRMVLKRALRNFSLLLCTILGLIITVTLVSSIPLYSDAAVARLLQRELKDVNGRPPGTLLISYFAPNDAPPLTFSATPTTSSSPAQDQFPTGPRVTMDTYNRLNNFITGQVPVQIRLPISTTSTYGATETQRMFPVDEAKRKIEEKARYVEVAYLSDMFKQGRIKIVDGELPGNGKDKDGDLPAIVNQGTADDLRLQVGDRYVLPGRDQYHPVALTVKIVGIWDAVNPDDPDWIYKPTVFDKQVFVTQDNFFKDVITTLPDEPHEYSWYYILDHTYIRPLNVNQIRIGLATINVRANEILPETGIRISPDEALQGYETKVFFLQLLLVALSIPTLGVVLYYIVTSVNLIVDRQRNEIALLKSRGMSTLQILGVYLLEGLLVGIVAGVVGPLLGALIAQLIGQTYGFLLFAQRKPLEIIFSQETIKYVLIAVGVAMAANLIPVIGAARNTIVSYKQEIARSAKLPFVQRFFLDFALLAVAIYGWWTLSQRTNILTFSQEGDVFVDPLLLLIPSLGIIAAALIFIRFFPLLARLASWIGERIFGVSILLALRQIARAPGQYSPIVLMLILTTALGYFSASAAHTIEQNNYDKSYYSNGADMVLDERWDYDDTNNEWIPPLAVDYTQVPGVQAQSRVMERGVEVSKVRPSVTGSLIGVDRWDFERTAWYRSDFSNDSSSLGGLMNLLATDDSAILAPEDYVAKQGLQRGSEIVLNINGREATFTLAGTFKYFPTWQPKKSLADEPVFVGNLDYIIDQGGVYPYQIWLKTDSGVTNDVLTKYALSKDVLLLSVKNARVELAQSRIDPQRTGLFGVLSVGFIVAAMLSVFSYLLYSFLSFQRRMLQFGILRATGLSVLQLTFMLVFEQIILMLVSVGVGTYIGATASNLFIPFLQVSAQKQLPPALTVPAWNDVTKIYIVLGLLLLVALISLITLLLRMKVYQAVKLGEEQ